MTENDIAAEILVRTRRDLPGAVVVKHNDAGTVGIPDIQVARCDRTSWGELKFVKPGRSLKQVNKVQQLIFCHELAVVNNGRCWVLVYEDLGEPLLTVWQPRVLFRHLWPSLAGPDPEHPKWRTIGFQALDVDDWEPAAGLVPLLMVHGALRGPWSYDALTRMVKDAVRG